MAGQYVIQIVSQGGPCFYAGSKRLTERKAERTTHLKSKATRFESEAEATKLVPWLVLGRSRYPWCLSGPEAAPRANRYA
jgi:hypothetical protein